MNKKKFVPIDGEHFDPNSTTVHWPTVVLLAGIFIFGVCIVYAVCYGVPPESMK